MERAAGGVVSEGGYYLRDATKTRTWPSPTRAGTEAGGRSDSKANMRFGNLD